MTDPLAPGFPEATKRLTACSDAPETGSPEGVSLGDVSTVAETVLRVFKRFDLSTFGGGHSPVAFRRQPPGRIHVADEFVGSRGATRATGKGLASLYRLALEGSIRHRLSADGKVQLNREDLSKLRPAKPNWRGRLPDVSGKGA